MIEASRDAGHHGFSKGRRDRLPVYVAFALVAVLSAWYFAKTRFAFNVPYDEQSSLASLAAYAADRPFQYRVLVPAIVNLIPPWLIETIRMRFFAIEFVATLGTILAFRAWLRFYFSDALLCSFLSLLIVPCMVFNFVLPQATPLWFPWDIPSVMFLTLGLLLLQQKRWWLFYPLFIVATFNRETTCFLTIIFFFGYWNERKTTSYWLHLSAQTLLWISIKLGLMVVFRENGGQFLYHHIEANWALLGQASSYPLLLSSTGFTWIIAVVGFSAIPSPFVRRALLSLIPFLIGMFLVGRILETRIYGDLIPLTLCATILIVASFCGERKRADTEDIQGL